MTTVSINKTRVDNEAFAAGVQFGSLVARMEADQRRVIESQIHASSYAALLDVADRLGWRIESSADFSAEDAALQVRAIRLMS